MVSTIFAAISVSIALASSFTAIVFPTIFTVVAIDFVPIGPPVRIRAMFVGSVWLFTTTASRLGIPVVPSAWAFPIVPDHLEAIDTAMPSGGLFTPTSLSLFAPSTGRFCDKLHGNKKQRSDQPLRNSLSNVLRFAAAENPTRYWRLHACMHLHA